MSGFRNIVRRYFPPSLRRALSAARSFVVAEEPHETQVLHDYEFVRDDNPRPRMTLVIPSVAPHNAFGGVTTGVDIFLEIGARAGADLRVLCDDFERTLDRSLVEARARIAGVDGRTIEVVRRLDQTPKVPVRSREIFVSYNWWTSLNIRSLLDAQLAAFGGPPRPFLYPIQEYEPLFYPFSSSHMLARLAFDPTHLCWGLFNSHQLRDFFVAQGHKVARSHVFEPKISSSLRPALMAGPTAKARRILIYGRPSIARNCFPAIERGLKLWARDFPEFADWEVVSAGMPHAPLPFGPGRTVTSLGKLSLDDYAKLLRTTAVGVSLMSSPHPSYPPLEMAHFGIRTVTNRYANKDLATAHDNIISTPDIDGTTIANAIAEACRGFLAAPDAGWAAKSHMPAYLDDKPWIFLDEVAMDLKALWAELP